MPRAAAAEALSQRRSRALPAGTATDHEKGRPAIDRTHRRRELTVTTADTAGTGQWNVPVLGTPRVLALAEAATVAALDSLEAGPSVGAEVHLNTRSPRWEAGVARPAWSGRGRRLVFGLRHPGGLRWPWGPWNGSWFPRRFLSGCAPRVTPAEAGPPWSCAVTFSGSVTMLTR